MFWRGRGGNGPKGRSRCAIMHGGGSSSASGASLAQDTDPDEATVPEGGSEISVRTLRATAVPETAVAWLADRCWTVAPSTGPAAFVDTHEAAIEGYFAGRPGSGKRFGGAVGAFPSREAARNRAAAVAANEMSDL